MNSMPSIEFLTIEMKNLREELRALKHCQILYVGLAFSTTCAILGLAKGTLDKGCPSFVFLAPLVVIFPTFSFFFDKAKTITRIVGYYRLLESVALGQATPKIFPGWENALEVFRNVESTFKTEVMARRGKPAKLPKVFLRVFCFKPPFVYWSLSFVTFAVVAVLCPVIALVTGSSWLERIVAGILLVGVLWLSYVKLDAVSSLTEGRDSYGVNWDVWRKILIEGNQGPS